MTKQLILLLITFLFTGCATALKKEAAPAPVSFKQKLTQASSYAQSKPQKSIKILTQALQEHPENNLSDDALFLLGKLFLKTKKSQSALKSFSRILESKFSSPIDGKAILQLSKIQLQKGEKYQALKTLSYIEKHELLHQQSLEEIETTRLPLLIEDENFLQYIASVQNILNVSKDEKKKERLYTKALGVQEIKFSGAQSNKILKNPALKDFHAYARLNLAEHYFENDNSKMAKEILLESKNLFNTVLLQDKKQELLQRSHSYETPDKNTIGVLIPLSGRYKSVGQKILDGLQYSLGLWSQRNKRRDVKLSILDTAAEPEQLKLVFDEMMKTDKPLAFIGGLVSRTAKALIEKAEESRTPVIILSQKEELAKNSKYSFQITTPISSYTDFLAKLSVEKLNVKKIAIAKSNKAFSQKYADSFEKSFVQFGGEVTEVVEYNMDEKQAMPQAVKKLVHLYSKEERKDEYVRAYRKWKRLKKNRRALGHPRLEEVLPPIIEFDALFIADGPKNSGLLASTLAYFDVEGPLLLGTHLWNNPSLITRGQRFVEKSIFAHSNYEPQLLTSACGQKFSRFYGEPLKTYSYRGLKAGLIIRELFELAKDKLNSRSQALHLINKVNTLTHPCLLNGLVKRENNFSSPLIPLTVKDKNIVKLRSNF